MISIGSDNLVTLTGLIDNTTSSYQNAATVTGQLQTSTGATVGTSFTLTYVVASNGTYRGTLPASTTSAITLGNEYQVKVTAVSSGNTLILWLTDISGNTVG